MSSMRLTKGTSNRETINANQIVKLKKNSLAAASLVVVIFCVLLTAANPAFAQGTIFTYQGHLVQNGVAANGNFDLRFGLCTNLSIGNTNALETNTDIAITNGVFTTSLNFSNVFNGTAYWLEIGVRTNGSAGAFTTLTPRQPITPAPYAITASNLTGTLPASQLSGTLPAGVITGSFSNSVSFTNTNNVFSGNGSGLTNVPGPTQTNYLYVYDTNVQPVSVAGTFQTVSFSTVGISNGWTIPSSAVFTVSQSGLYLVQYQAHIQNTTGSTTATVITHMILNIATAPSELSSSESLISVPPLNGIGEINRSFLVQLTAGQTLSLQYTANVATFVALVSGLFEGQSFPSVAMTVNRLQ